MRTTEVDEGSEVHCKYTSIKSLSIPIVSERQPLGLGI